MSQNLVDRAFPNLTDKQKSRLFELAEEQFVPSGGIIIGQHDIPDFLGVMVSGSARVLQETYDQTNFEFIGPLGPGDVFGEMSFIDQQPSSATLITDGDVTYMKFGRVQIINLIENNNEFGKHFYHSLLLVMCKRLRATNIRVQPT